MLVDLLVTAITAASVVGCSIENGQESMAVPDNVSENGSVELESGIRVVVDDDLDALRDGTLEFRPVAQGGHDAE